MQRALLISLHPGDKMVVAYDPAWPGLFETLKTSIWGAVADIAISVEHVGSTSVPGLAAKPIIDMDVVVPDAELAEGIRRLAALGYEHRGDLGIVRREAFRPPAGSVPHNLYLCSSNSPALANHLALRNYLRDNPEAARAYGEVKMRLALAHAGDLEAYVEGKTEFITSILRQVGFSQAALSDIEVMNRKRRDKSV
jgi:GrpB-like predicted nucleotidyltransferase (UPF0157 family)